MMFLKRKRIINQLLRLMQLTLVDLMKKQVDDAGKKMPDASGLVKKKVITQKLLRQNVKYLVLLTGLATTSALNAVENKTPKISVLVQKTLTLTDYNANVLGIETKYLIKSDYNKFTGEVLDIRVQFINLIFLGLQKTLINKITGV